MQVRKSRLKIGVASAPPAGITLRTRVGKRSSSHLDKVSFSEIIPRKGMLEREGAKSVRLKMFDRQSLTQAR